MARALWYRFFNTVLIGLFADGNDIFHSHPCRDGTGSCGLINYGYRFYRRWGGGGTVDNNFFFI